MSDAMTDMLNEQAWNDRWWPVIHNLHTRGKYTLAWLVAKAASGQCGAKMEGCIDKTITGCESYIQRRR